MDHLEKENKNRNGESAETNSALPCTWHSPCFPLPSVKSSKALTSQWNVTSSPIEDAPQLAGSVKV